MQRWVCFHHILTFPLFEGGDLLLGSIDTVQSSWENLSSKRSLLK